MPALEDQRRVWLTAAALAAITALAGYLRLVDLGRAGLGNLFYASAIRSMGESAHNFIYAAYDPAGTISIDKPPLALWIQVLSTKLFGYEGWAMILPMAIAGTVAVPLVYFAARRRLGIWTALAAALVLAIFPESVATARDSTMDALVMALLAGGAWLMVVAVEDRRPWLLVAWTALMGLLFNVKFFEGFVILPAALLYLGWRWRDRWRSDARLLLAPLATAAAVGLVVSLAWVTLVELTPEADRPLVMNDDANSAYGLVFRYNGLERVFPSEVTIFQPVGNLPPSDRLLSLTRSFGVDNRGVFRLFEDTNGPLIGVTVAIALAGIAVAAWRRRDWLLDGPGLLWTVWLLTGVVFFSASNRAAAHYTEAYAPAVAVLAGLALVEAWRARAAWRSLVLPAALLALCWFAWTAYADLEPLRSTAFRAAVVTAAAASAAALALSTLTALPSFESRATSLRLPPIRDALRALAVAAILVVPFLTADWVAFDSPRGGQITRPNPVDFAREDEPPPIDRTVPAEPIIELAERDAPEARYALAVTGINDAGEAIAYTGASVLPLWNEYQREPVLDREALEATLHAGDVAYVLADRGLGLSGLASDLYLALESECSVVPAARLPRVWQLWSCLPD